MKNRVNSLARTSSITPLPNFSNLEKAIRRLQHASIKLDHEKAKVEKKFRKVFRRLLRKAHKCNGRRHSKFRSFVKRIFGVRKTMAGTATLRREEEAVHVIEKRAVLENVRLGKAAAGWGSNKRSDAIEEILHDVMPPDELDARTKQPWCSLLKTAGDAWSLDETDPGRLPRKFLKARKAVVKVNAKLKDFERGFISSEGIKDREWYR